MFPNALHPPPDFFPTPLRLTASPTAPGETITLARLTVNSPTRISWGDGASQILPANNTSAVTHVYAASGTYRILVEDAKKITQINLDSAKLGGLNTADLRYSQITYFVVTVITSSIIRSSDMTAWRPTDWLLYSMPAGTYSISSADMTAWRPTYWLLYSMPAGTYSISSADMTAWLPTNWVLSSMSSGTYSISSADMTAWLPTTWRLYSMPAAGSSYTFAASCMRTWTAFATLLCNDLGLDAAAVDTILADLYAGRMGYIATAPTANLGGTNADPNGVYQAQVPPTTGMETKYELVNDSAAQGFKKWAITT